MRNFIVPIFIFFVCIIASKSIIAQEFLVTDIIPTPYSRPYTIDPITNEIYIVDIFTDIYRVKIGQPEKDLTSFQKLPVFANNSRLTAYIYNDTLYLNDLENERIDTITGVFERNAVDSFSPNDLTIQLASNKFFYLPEEKFYENNASSVLTKFTWSSDTTIIYCDDIDGFIYEYNIMEDTWDTLFVTVGYDHLESCSYNIPDKILAYSQYLIRDTSNTTIHFLDIKTGENSLIFDKINDLAQTTCRQSSLMFKELEWSTDGSRLAYFSDPLINSASGILVHFLDSSSTFLFTDCDQYGVKRDISWLNNDTIIYYDGTRNGIYGYDVHYPITGIESEELEFTEYESIKNYPNPFNSSTRFQIKAKQRGMGFLHIYSILGEKIYSHNIGDIIQGTNIYDWNGINMDGNYIANGIYIVVAELEYETIGSSRIAKKIMVIK